jgi:UDP-perosamine 4-acetyltransferase
MHVVVYGSRPDGHARVVLEVLLEEESMTVVGLIDDEPENGDRSIGAYSVIGSRLDLRRLASEGVQGVILGFGAVGGRAAVISAVEEAGLALPTLVHPTAHVSRSATLAEGVQILPHASVGPGARVGRGVLVNTGAVVEHDVVLSDCTVLGPGAVLTGRVRIGESVDAGAGAIVLPDIQVGAHAVVGAGAVVTRSVPSGEVVAGVPARRIRGPGSAEPS